MARQGLLIWRRPVGQGWQPAAKSAAALPSEGNGRVHFAIPEGTTSITQAGWRSREDSWEEWGVDKTHVTRVTIPSSVITIGDNVFFRCSSLASLAIPSSVTSIGDFAFQDCSSLARLQIPSSVTSIGRGAFRECTNLATLVVFRKYADSPADTTLTVHASAFHNCGNIKVVSAPDVVVAALGDPYTGCSTLASLPRSVTFSASKLQLETYFWSMKLHRNTSRLSTRQRAWIKHLLTVRSRIRLHWKPVNKGPRSVPCTPIPQHPPLPCGMNGIWLLVLESVQLSELGALACASDDNGDARRGS